MRMITKHNVIVIGIAIIISALIFVFWWPWKKHKEVSPQLSYNTFYKQTGWGYEVLVDGKTIIHQEIVPALPVETGFSKKEYAEKAAQLVIQKLQRNDLPTLTKTDLSSICLLDSISYEQPRNR